VGPHPVYPVVQNTASALDVLNAVYQSYLKNSARLLLKGKRQQPVKTDKI
jgi:hypothetical protein